MNNSLIKVLILIIILIILNVCVFCLISDFSITRIINIIFLNISFITSWVCIAINNKNEKFKYLNYTKIPFVIVYLLATIISSIVLINNNSQNIQTSIVVHIIIVGLFSIMLLINKLADNATEKNK